MPTDPDALAGRLALRRSVVPASVWLLGVLALVVAGCEGSSSHGPTHRKVGELRVGSDAKLVSSDGSDVTLDRILGAPPGKSASRSAQSARTEKLKLPVGTAVLVQDMVGDDAHVVIKGGPSDGTHCWVECLRLEPAGE